MKSLPIPRLAALPLILCLAGSGLAQGGIDWVTVGDPGNPNHPSLPSIQGPQEGSVPYAFDIGKFEVTNANYVGFLSAVAESDPNELWYWKMGADALGGIDRAGAPGSYVYTLKPGAANRPVVFVSFWNAARFANWMHNGQPVGNQDATTTEDGAYTLDPVAMAANTVTRNPGARFALPTRPEFWKAGYYEANTQSWYLSPARSNTMLSGGAPLDDDGNTGNIHRPLFVLEEAGSYPLSVGPHGTFDMGGNAYEWLERITFDRREVAGGAFGTGAAGSNINAGTNMQRAPGFLDAQSGLRLVRLTAAAETSFRNAGSNPASYSATPPGLGADWTVTVDLTTTGHTFAQVIGTTAPANAILNNGQVLLVGGARLFQVPLQAGPVASWTLPLPTTPSLAGLPLYTQAVHILGMSPFALSNAQDLTIGY